MTLKSFHIAFIIICTLLCTFLIVWSFFVSADRSPVALSLGIGGILGLFALPVYGIHFLRKIRNEHL